MMTRRTCIIVNHLLATVVVGKPKTTTAIKHVQRCMAICSCTYQTSEQFVLRRSGRIKNLVIANRWYQYRSQSVLGQLRPELTTYWPVATHGLVDFYCHCQMTKLEVTILSGWLSFYLFANDNGPILIVFSIHFG